ALQQPVGQPPRPAPLQRRRSTHRRSSHCDGIRHRVRDGTRGHIRRRLQRLSCREFECCYMASLGHQLPKNPHPKQLRRTSKAYSFALSLNVATTHKTPPGNASFWDCDSPDTSGHLFENFASALEEIIALAAATCRA